MPKKLNLGKHGNSLLANCRDVLSGSGYEVEVMILHYFLTFHNELTGKCEYVGRVTLKRENKNALLEAKTVEDILKIFWVKY